MKVGFELTQRGADANPDAILELAQLGEDLGYDSLWANDHVVIPREVRTPYPYGATGRHPFAQDVPYLEGLTVLAFVAGWTRRLGLGISVLILPQRNPVLAAKVAASLDVLSKGRLILGVGSGWLAEEFEALDMPFAQRGARTDEFLRVMKALWTEDHPRFQGRFYTLEDVIFYPKPVQKPHMPLWIGGEANGALRRAAALGDSYHPADRGLEPFEKVAERYKRVQELARGYGRDPSSIEFTLRTTVNFARDGVPAVVRRFQEYRQAGVAHVLASFQPATLEAVREGMTLFAREVRPALAS